MKDVKTTLKAISEIFMDGINHLCFAEYQDLYFKEFSKYVEVVDKKRYSKMYGPVLECYGVNSPAFTDRTKGMFIICDDVPDKDYLDFLEKHEIWEDYITNKEGFNLFIAESKDRLLPINLQTRPAHTFASY